MTKLTRFFGTCVLVVSLFTVALAGDILTPPAAPPAPPAEFTVDCSSVEASTPAQDSSIDIVTEATTMLATWLEAAIF